MEAEPGELKQSAEQGSPSEQMVTWIAGAQRPLFAYIRSLVGPWGDVEEILQEVNLVLWRKASEYDGRGQFLTWACKVAYLQVLAYLKLRRRDRHSYFDEAVLADLAEPLAERVQELDSRMAALRHCLEQLPPVSRRLITVRYGTDGSVQAAAEELGRTAESVRVTLHRIRQQLLSCIERTLAVGGPS